MIFTIQILRNVCWFMIYKQNFYRWSLSFLWMIFLNILVCTQFDDQLETVSTPAVHMFGYVCFQLHRLHNWKFSRYFRTISKRVIYRNMVIVCTTFCINAWLRRSSRLRITKVLTKISIDLRWLWMNKRK